MKTIWKFPLKNQNVQNVAGHGLHVISAGLDPESDLCVWAKVDSDQEVVVAKIAICGTGHPLPPDDFEFVDTVRYGPLMWHVFATRAAS